MIERHQTPERPVQYEAPAVTTVGTLHDLTLGCDKALGSSDGFTFLGDPIVCRSA